MNQNGCESKAKEVGSIRWIYLAVSALGLFFVGIIYAWSIFKVPFSEEFGWEASKLAFTYTLTMCFFCLGSLVSGYLSKKVSVRSMLAAAAMLILAGFLVSSRLNAEDLVLMYCSYGVLIGMGIGLAYNTLLSVGNSWFPDKKGTSSGILMMCFGFSTMILGRTASALFESAAFGWRKTYVLMGCAIAVVLVICLVVLRKPSAGVVFPKKKAGGKKDEESFEQRDYSTAEVVRRPAFWLFYLYGTLAASVGSAVISFARELSMTLGADASAATTLVGVLSVCNGLGRIFCGLSFDRMGRRKTMLAVSLVTMIAPSIMILALLQNSLILGIVSLCLTGVSYGCCPTISSAFIGTFYGMKDFSMNYSISNTKMLFSSFAATMASSLLASTGSYVAPFVMLLGFTLLSFVLNFTIKRP